MNKRNLAILLILFNTGACVQEDEHEALVMQPPPRVEPQPSPLPERTRPDVSEAVEVSSVSKKTLESVLEDLEVIQEKRMIRIRKKPRKAAADGIEFIAGEGGSVGSGRSAGYGTLGVAPAPGQLTAGEWRDLEHWDHWVELHTATSSPSIDNFSQYQASWGLHTARVYPVQLHNRGGAPVCDAEVLLQHPDTGRPVWTARTDNRGRAWMFDGIGEVSSDRELTLHAAGSSAAVGKVGRTTTMVVDAPACEEALDLMVLVDTTSSMSDELHYLKSELEDVLERGAGGAALQKIRTSVGFYRDEGDDYVLRSFPFTSHRDMTIRQLREQGAAGGGDAPEALDVALLHAVKGNEWSAQAKARLLVVVLDAPPHNEGALRFRTAVEAAAAKGIRILPVVASGMPKEGEYLMRSAAVATGGTYVFLTDDSGIGNSHTAPTAGPHDVGYLNDLLEKLIAEWVR